MSSKNRGAVSIESDWYATPEETTRAVLRELAADIASNCPGGEVRRILEPTAGRGAIVKVLREFFPLAEITAIELDRSRFERLEKMQIGTAYCADYGEVDAPEQRYDLAVLNPPFTIAQAIVQKAKLESLHTLSLLRLGFLASAKRRPFWRMHPADILPLSSRPSFAASLKCCGWLDEVRHQSCGWSVIQELEAVRPKRCPDCLKGDVSVTTSDSADYFWAHMWPGARPVRVL